MNRKDGAKVYGYNQEWFDSDDAEEAAANADVLEDECFVYEGTLKKLTVSAHLGKHTAIGFVETLTECIGDEQHEDWDYTDVQHSPEFVDELKKLVDKHITVKGGLWNIVDIKEIKMVRDGDYWARA